MATNNAINLKASGIVSYDGAGTFSALANPLTVSNGGTSASSFTAYSVLCGGTTSTSALQNVSGVGTSGQVLVSNGAGALPTWQTVSGGFGYTLSTVTATAGNPADATTYFLANGDTLTAVTSSGSARTRMLVPNSGTITKVYGDVSVGGTLGSSQNVTIAVRLNNTTDTNVTTTLQLTATQNSFSNTGLSISVTAGDYIEFKVVCPTWTTNPTTVYVSCYALVT